MIKLSDPFKIALQSILSNKTRSILTTLGVIIGVAAVITLVSMGEGAKTYVLNQVRGWGMGANSLTIHPGKAETTIPEFSLVYSDVIAMREKVKEIVYLVPEVIGKGRIKYGKKEYTPAFTMGISADYPLAVNQKAVEGRFYSKTEENARRRVVVLGKTVNRKIFGSLSPIGETVKINNIGFKVIGVLEEKGSMFMYDMDDLALIPITVSQTVLGSNKIYEIFLTLENENQVAQAQEKITELLIKRHKREDFHIHTQQGMIDLINNILNALTGIVSAIAAISLLVGGIGIMNIMLVAVNERVREIGVRKAIGAKSRDIVLQFLVESMMISLLGGALGIIIGLLGAFLIMFFIKGTLVIAWWAVILATVVSAVVGIFFGVYPAVRAARLDPVIALRYE